MEIIMKHSLIVLLFITLASVAHAGAWQWAQSFGATGMERAWDMAADDSSQALWIGGEYADSLLVNGIVYPGFGLSDSFVCKYTDTGRLLWVKVLGSTQEDVCLSIDTDSFGNCYFTGFYIGAMQDGDWQINANGLWDVFYGKLNPAGELMWLKSFGGPLNDIGYGIAVDAAGNIHIAGWFADSIVFDAQTTLSSYGGSDPFIAKFDTDGNFMWARHGGGIGVEYGYKTDIGADGMVYVTGSTGAGCNFDGLQTTSGGAFIACYDSEGNIQWLNSALNAGPININVDRHQMTGYRGLLTGRVTGFAQFGDFSMASVSGSDDAFCAEFDPASGSWLNLRHWGGSGSEKGRAADIRGSSAVMVSYENSVNFDGVMLDSIGSWDFAIVGEGNVPPAFGGGSVNSEVGTDVKILSDGRIAVSGWFSGLMRLGHYDLQSSNDSDQDAYIAVYDPSGSSVQDLVAPVTSRLACYPNPFKTTLNISSKDTSASGITIYNARGQKVIRLISESSHSETMTWTWSGRDAKGKQCPAGVYLIKADNTPSSRKIIYTP